MLNVTVQAWSNVHGVDDRDVHDDTRPYKETDVLPKPRNSYGASKFAFEELLASEWGRYVVRIPDCVLSKERQLDDVYCIGGSVHHSVK